MLITIIYILGLICFFFAMVDWPSGQGGRLVPAGLFCWLLATLLSRGM